MMQFKNYIKNQDNLFPLSALISCAILLIVFIMAQVLTYSSLDETELLNEKMEIRELVKLKLAPQRSKSREQNSNPAKAKIGKNEQPALQHAKRTRVVAALIHGFDIENHISKINAASRKETNHQSQQRTEITINFATNSEGLETVKFNSEFNNRLSSISRGRKRDMNNGQGPSVQTGVGSRRGVISSLDGNAMAGRATRRSSRMADPGSSGHKISFPTVSGGSEATLDLHALIKWMKNHPGSIPKLVMYEMGHKDGDLASSVAFTMNNRRFRLFLSCNEVEMLLRICLIEDNFFTLLKDNGIKEQSNYLTTGNVMRNNSQIKSLISSREAPRDNAAAFYNIFWSWWQQQEK